MVLNVFLSILKTFLVFGLGAAVLRLKILHEDDLKRLTRLALDIFFPFLTFHSITRDFTPERFNELWQLPLIGFGLMVAGGLAGIPLKRLMRHGTPERLKTFHHICAINNYVFLPVIVLGSIQSSYVSMVLVMNVGSTIGFWTIGIFTLTGLQGWRKTLASIFSINLVAVAAAVLVASLQIPVPVFVAEAVEMVGGMAVPFMLILVGAALWLCLKDILSHHFDLIYISVVRLLILPLILGVALKLLPLSADVYRVSLVVAAMPAASSSVLVAGQYGGSRSFAGQVIVITTLLSLGTIPLILWIFG